MWQITIISSYIIFLKSSYQLTEFSCATFDELENDCAMSTAFKCLQAEIETKFNR